MKRPASVARKGGAKALSLRSFIWQYDATEDLEHWHGGEIYSNGTSTKQFIFVSILKDEDHFRPLKTKQ
jgi:hypothetical protein